MFALRGLRVDPAISICSFIKGQPAHTTWAFSSTYPNRSYHHIPLEQSNAIRLAEILPGQGNDNLQLQLHHATLQDSPPYEALSYEWAGNTGLRPVRCGSQEFHLSANLRAALRRLRYANQRRLVWVDAICIDQHNRQERSHQVSMMREIYRKAQRALIWIGEEKEHTGSAFEIIPELAENWVSQGSGDDIPPILARDTGEPNANQLLDPSNSALWNSIIDVFTRPYFRRTWIIQEIIVSSEATVICGSYDVDWTSFHRAANHLVQDEFRASREPQPSTLFLIALIRRIERRFERGDLRLRTLLRHFRASKALDPRDKVFALLGLVSHDCSSNSGNPIPSSNASSRARAIKADYTKVIEDVYHETAAYIITEEQNLKLLTNEYPPNARELQNMPSWVPDWSANSKPLHPLIRKSDRLSTLIKGDIHCTTTSLFVNGNIFDTISYASEVITSSNAHFILHNLIKLMKAKTGTGSRYPATNQPHNEALCRTLVANNAILRPALDETERYFFYLLRDRMTTVQVPIIQEGLFNDLEFLLWANVAEKNEPYLRELRRTLYDRTFFTTRKGYMGIGPKGKTRVRVRDQVAVLGGGFTPFILRRIEGGTTACNSVGGDDTIGYTLVGESYIHGMMEGEFLEDGQELGHERIEIR
ncbi:hypothetical protein PABG_04098 [Paracoccidioides brasiliensis Pb03]|nr:hypothetical protein PABG_04098 [Paracoccidioides brasiliensis Pb03]